MYFLHSEINSLIVLICSKVHTDLVTSIDKRGKDRVPLEVRK